MIANTRKIGALLFIGIIIGAVTTIFPYINAAVSAPLSVGTITPTNPDLNLNITKVSAQATALGGGCFFPIVITLNVTWTGNGFYQVSINNFYLLLTSRNNLITNSTSTSVQNPTNTITGFQAFSGIPVKLALSFPKTCTAGLNLIKLVYTDGAYSFAFPLP